MNSTLFVLASLDGLSYAALVFLVSVGLSLIFGVLRIVNVAHGSLYAFGAYLAATLSLLVTPISPRWTCRCSSTASKPGCLVRGQARSACPRPHLETPCPDEFHAFRSRQPRRSVLCGARVPG
ncbi:MAG: hypothetical protein Q8L13_18650, partial [Bradyrhizobium sp.]|nr:hypothetical protein [Bradyrhizobium sp.]